MKHYEVKTIEDVKVFAKERGFEEQDIEIAPYYQPIYGSLTDEEKDVMTFKFGSFYGNGEYYGCFSYSTGELDESGIEFSMFRD